MDLISALLAYLVENYLRLYLVAGPICALVRYYSQQEGPAAAAPISILLLELILLLVVALIMLASIALAKMDCRPIASYLLVPVLLGLAYFWLAANHRHGRQHRPSWSSADDGGGEAPLPSRLASSLEWTLTGGLLALAVGQLACNSFGRQLAKVAS